MNDALLDEIYERSQGRKLTVVMIQSMLDQFFAEALAAGRDVQPALAKLGTIVDLLPVRESTISALRENMTDVEVEQMAALYRSPLGARLAEFAIDSAAQLSQIGQTWATQKIIVPALIAAGIDAEQAANMDIDLDASWPVASFENAPAGARELARQVLAAAGFVRRIDEMIATQTGALASQGLQVVPPTAEDKEALIDSAAEPYTRYFSLDELVALQAFYDTPFGHRFVDLAPLLGKAGEAAIEAWNEANPGELERQIGAVAELLQ